MQKFLIALMMLVIVPVGAVGQDEDETTVPGPEANTLLPATTGYVLFAFGRDKPDDIDGTAFGDCRILEPAKPGLSLPFNRTRSSTRRHPGSNSWVHP